MKNYYQLSAEETMKELNGSTEPLTDEQVKEHREKYGPNELVEGKKKSTLQIFLEHSPTSPYMSRFFVFTGM